MLIFRTGITVILLGAFSQVVQAQSVLSRLELGLQAGTLIYQGDLTPSRLGSFRTPGYHVGGSLAYRLNHFLSVRGNLTYGKLRGDDSKYDQPEWRQHRNFNFSARILEFTSTLVWNVRGNPENNAGLSPYVFAGAGVSFTGIRRDASKLDTEFFATESALQTGLIDDMARRTPRIMPVIPVGLGVRYPLTQRLSVHAESSYRITFTDYLDGFSRAASPTYRDRYYGISLGIFYRLNDNSAIQCPEVPR
jgi:hypothetical protein